MSKKVVTGDDGKQYTMKVKKPFYKRGWFIGICAVIVIGIGASAMGGGSDDSSSSSDEKSSQTDKKDTAKTYKLNELASGKTFGLKANATSTTDKLGVEGLESTADGVYRLVNVEYTNKDKKSQMVTSSDFQMKIDGKTYDASDDTLNIENNNMFLKDVGPDVTAKGTIAFDIPVKYKDAKATLVLHNSIWGTDDVNISLN